MVNGADLNWWASSSHLLSGSQYLYAKMSLCVSGLISKVSGLFNTSTFCERSRRKALLQHRLDPPNRHNPARKCPVGQGGGDKGIARGSERGLELPTTVESNL